MKRRFTKSILALACSAGAFTFAAPAARADHIDFRYRDRDVRHDERRVWVEPVYEDRCNKVWVEPVYRTESCPVRVDGYWDTRCERVWVEPVYEYREVVRYEHGRRFCSRERVCVRQGGWQNVERRVWVPEHFRHEDRQILVCAGHWEERRERVCVREGYWQTLGEHDHHHGGGGTFFGLNLRF
jgi:hypothetical protein